MTNEKRELALRIAEPILHKLSLEIGYELRFMDEFSYELEYGWVFIFNSEEFVKTRNPRVSLGGNGPILVDLEKEVVELLPSFLSVNEAVLEYEKKR